MSEIQVNTINEYTSANGVTIDGVLIKDGAINKSYISDFGLKEFDTYILTADINGTSADITANWQRKTTTGFEKIGTGVSESSGIFSFPSTGYWLVGIQAIIEKNNADQLITVRCMGTDDNFSSETEQFKSRMGGASTTTMNFNGYSQGLFKCTDVANDKVKFNTFSFGTNTILISGVNNTQFHFMKIGEI
jgi:hypothetical protein